MSALKQANDDPSLKAHNACPTQQGCKFRSGEIMACQQHVFGYAQRASMNRRFGNRIAHKDNDSCLHMKPLQIPCDLKDAQSQHICKVVQASDSYEDFNHSNRSESDSDDATASITSPDDRPACIR